MTLNLRSLSSFLFVLIFLFGFRAEASNLNQSPLSTAILVDKKTNSLYVSEYQSSGYKVLKVYHVTLGQVQGDKEDENDLKTPEGIYTFTSYLTPPFLQKKFGVMSFNMDFPNAFDRLAGTKGSGIMLHATDEPERLKKNYDSQGCIVVKNEEIREIKPYIRLGLTPIIVYAELTEEYMHPGDDLKLRAFFESWVQNWENKKIDDYISAYHSEFSANGKNKAAWKSYKNRLNAIYSSIEIKPEKVLIYKHPKYSRLTFTQNYRSQLKGGGWGHRSRGTKILYIAEERGEPKIIAESFTPLEW